MADNIIISNDPLTNYAVAADEVGGVLFQRIKLIESTDDSTTPIGVVANPLIVDEALNALTAASPTYATIGTSSTAAVTVNANRKGLVIVNTSNNTVSLAIGTSAVLYSGITLYPQGAWSMDEYSFCTGAINAIASAVGSNIAIQEFS